eukprot:scaffold700_cov22-Tisochrysis_lutea.AAC.1
MKRASDGVGRTWTLLHCVSVFSTFNKDGSAYWTAQTPHVRAPCCSSEQGIKNSVQPCHSLSASGRIFKSGRRIQIMLIADPALLSPHMPSHSAPTEESPLQSFPHGALICPGQRSTYEPPSPPVDQRASI